MATEEAFVRRAAWIAVVVAVGAATAWTLWPRAMGVSQKSTSAIAVQEFRRSFCRGSSSRSGKVTAPQTKAASVLDWRLFASW